MHNTKKPGEAQLRCSVCDFSVKRPEYLRKHMATHERRHRCEFPGCGKAFARADRLASHVAHHDPTLRCSCPHAESGCTYTTTSARNVKRHLKTCQFALEAAEQRLLAEHGHNDATAVAVRDISCAAEAEGAVFAPSVLEKVAVSNNGFPLL